jgi:hypothetical protein
MLTRRSALAALGSLPFFAKQAAPTVIGGAEAFRTINKALWVWKIDWTAVEELRAFASKQGIATLFVSLSRSARTRLVAGDEEPANAIRSLSAAGLEVWALAGDPGWLEQPTQIPEPLQELIKVQETRALFHGLHLDVEPQADPRWRLGDGSRTQLLEAFVRFLTTVAAHTTSLPIEAAIHPAMARLNLSDGSNALRRIGEHVSRMSIMAYRDSAAATLDWAASTLEILMTMETSWRMGVLVHQSAENRISFFNAPLSSFMREIIELDRSLRASSTRQRYRGLVFEDYDGLRGLLGG